MGLIKEKINILSNTLDKYIYCDKMDNNILVKKGILNTDNSDAVISNNIKIVVGENQYLIIVHNNEIIDSTTESGVYIFEEESELDDVYAYFINSSYIDDNKFKTKNPIQYFDNNLNITIDIKCYGKYIIQIIDPIKFYNQNIKTDDFKNLFLSKFLENFEVAISKLSEKKLSYDNLTDSMDEVTNVFREVLKSYCEECGINIINVSISSVTPTIESFELIKQKYKEKTKEEIMEEKQNICPICETTLPEDAKFCFKCGNEI